MKLHAVNGRPVCLDAIGDVLRRWPVERVCAWLEALPVGTVVRVRWDLWVRADLPGLFGEALRFDHDGACDTEEITDALGVCDPCDL